MGIFIDILLVWQYYYTTQFPFFQEENIFIRFFSIFQKNNEEAWLNKFLAETVGYRALAQETYGKARDGQKRG